MEPSKVKAIAIFSGGLDSTTVVYEMIDLGYDIDLVSFNYGQRHKKELEYAKRTANRLGLRHDICDLSGLAPLLAESGSSLVSEETVPEGHYAADNMRSTIVPNRNMVMISIAASIAVARKANYVVTGVHAGDHDVYPDCRPAFINTTSQALAIGNEGYEMYGILAPYIRVSKAQIAKKAFQLGVPIEETWSCYKGNEHHCGRCGTCVERLEAISDAIELLDQEDPNNEYRDLTLYEDEEFWVDAVATKESE